ncbi:MAG: hypothetical protein KI785_10825, partial [Devosiaceae bacterium]|nr:hypothetical protein [Devosiaceae bacterium MH13]
DGDGRAEVITIRASVRLGGSVAVYGVREGALMELGATPFIGRANRWLNVAGVADFLGTGDRQIAFVETPHIGGTLKLARFSGGRLSVIASEAGYSNHEIRAREMRLSAVADIDGDGRMDLALPNASRSTLELVRFTGGRIATLDRVALPARVAGPIIADGRGDGLAFTMLLADGSVVDVRR